MEGLFPTTVVPTGMVACRASCIKICKALPRLRLQSFELFKRELVQVAIGHASSAGELLGEVPDDAGPGHKLFVAARAQVRVPDVHTCQASVTMFDDLVRGQGLGTVEYACGSRRALQAYMELGQLVLRSSGNANMAIGLWQAMQWAHHASR